MSKINFMKKDNLTQEGAAFTYFIELINREGDDIVMRGWVYSAADEPVDVTLLREDKTNLEAGRIWRKTRRDVKKEFELDNDYKAEFLIRFKRDEITDDTIYLKFSPDGVSSDSEPMLVAINMSGLDYSFTTGGRFAQFLTDQPVKRGLRLLGKGNPVGIYHKLRAKIKGTEDAYTIWRRVNCPGPDDYEKQRKAEFEYNPLISISIPLYNTPLEFFTALMDSIMGQTYGNFQLCLADGSDTDALGKYIEEHYKDERIDYVHLDKNLGIAGNTNKALEMARGEFVMLTDHDDILDIAALYEIVNVLNNDSSTDIIYTDEDLVDASGMIYSNYRFKPDFNLEMLRHLNYICHIFCVRKTIMEQVGGFKEEYDGAQDFDMILRCCEKSDKIYHIPKVLYHWRAHEDSTAGNADSKQYAIDASVRALREHYRRVGIDADVEATDIFIMLKTTRKLKATPLVSILIPTKDHIDDLDKCIQSIIDKTNYKNYEIIVIENNSTDDNTFAYYDKIQAEHDNIKVCTWKPAEGETFNYSKINNFGVEHANGDYYILLNNDIEVISSDWIDRMLGYCMEDDCGAVGAKLLYPDDTVQHCGIIIGVGGFAGHILTEQDIEDVGYFGRLRVQQEISAVTAACMMVDAKVFNEVGGFDENFAVALNDVDLCLKIRDADKKIILDPNITMYHYESKSRGYEESEAQVKRFKKEIKRFRDKWGDIIENGDPYYSPNLTYMYGDCSPRGVAERFLIVEEIEQDESFTNS